MLVVFKKINKRPDIMKSDIPTEVWEVLQSGK